RLPAALQGGQHVDELLLVLRERREPASGRLARLPELLNPGAPLLRELLVALELGFALLPPAIELILHRDELASLGPDPIPEPLDVHHERAILAARQEEILVAGQQIGERFGAQHHL